METVINKKKKNKKPIFILLGTIVFFILFIILISRPSELNLAIEEVQLCNNTAETKEVFDKHKSNLLENNEEGEKQIALEFQNAVRNKLASFQLSDDEINKCLEWLPPAKTSINLIVVPDLSRRIVDNVNNPNQVANDKLILASIWKSFTETSYLKINSKDQLIIDTTDPEQAKGQFYEIANQLQFDLSKNQGKSNRLYFTEDKTNQFNESIEKLYQIAQEKPMGADYVFYFKRYLESRIKKSTLHDHYANKVIIVTDGYLEAQNRKSDTPINDLLYKSLRTGNTKEVITNQGLNISNVSIDLSNTEVLICEVNERKTGQGKDFEILKSYWTDWLERMHVKNKVQFLHREHATNITTQKIDDFIKGNR